MTAAFSESAVEQAAVAWLESAGWQIRNGADIAPGEPATERGGDAQEVMAHAGPTNTRSADTASSPPGAPARRTAAVLLAALLALAGCARLAPAPALDFALLGDVPYTPAQAAVLDTMIDDMNAARLAFAVHVGDITSGQGPCTDEWLLARKSQFARFAMPFVLLPGDNEWTDCHRTGFDPAERLARWRTLFCEPLGRGALPLERQSEADPRHRDYCEHLRRPAIHFAVFYSASEPYADVRDRIIPANGHWMDPVALYRNKLPLDSASMKALPESEKRVPIPVMFDNGETFPAKTKIVWPYTCTRR